MSKILIKVTLFLGLIFCSSLIYANTNSSDKYHIKVYLNNQSVEVFRNGSLLKKMPCSTGIKTGSTLKGKFKTYTRKESDIWIETDGSEIKYYYITRFNDKNAFHSMIEGEHPLVKEGKKLFAERKPSSMGCIRLRKEDAKWIYNLPLDTPVEIFDSIS